MSYPVWDIVIPLSIDSKYTMDCDFEPTVRRVSSPGSTWDLSNANDTLIEENNGMYQ